MLSTLVFEIRTGARAAQARYQWIDNLTFRSNYFCHQTISWTTSNELDSIHSHSQIFLYYSLTTQTSLGS